MRLITSDKRIAWDGIQNTKGIENKKTCGSKAERVQSSSTAKTKHTVACIVKIKISQENAQEIQNFCKCSQHRHSRDVKKNQSFLDQHFWKSNTRCFEKSGKISENRQKGSQLTSLRYLHLPCFHVYLIMYVCNLGRCSKCSCWQSGQNSNTPLITPEEVAWRPIQPTAFIWEMSLTTAKKMEAPG